MKHFRKTTMGKPVIMGRKTFASLGKPLIGRQNIVLTRNSAYQAEGVHVATSAKAALKLADSLYQAGDLASEDCEAMIIGGKAIYDIFIEQAERIYYTGVHIDPAGDVTFWTLSRLREMGWTEISRQEQSAGERDEADMSFIVLEK